MRIPQLATQVSPSDETTSITASQTCSCGKNFDEKTIKLLEKLFQLGKTGTGIHSPVNNNK